MKLLIALALAMLATVALTACQTAPEPAPPPEPAFLAEPPQLVTEDYLRRQLDIATAKSWALVAVEMLAGPVHRFQSRVSMDSPHWDKDKTVTGSVILNDAPGRQRHFAVSIKFSGHNYDTNAGTVTNGSCHRLPGAGVQTTGEFTTVANHTGEPVSHHIEKSVTEETSSEINLTESLELSNGTTVEAGTDVAKVSDTLSETFGISKSETRSKSSSTTVTVSDDLDIDPGTTVAISFSTDNSATDCTVHINAAGDWTGVSITVTTPHEDEEEWKGIHFTQPGVYRNLSRLFGSDAVGFDGRNATIHVNQSDQFYRLAMGYDVRCPYCKYLQFSTFARAELAKIADDKTRWISFDGLRHSTSREDASYTAVDVTGCDGVTVSDTLSKSGQSVATLDTDNNGRLDACEQ